MESIRQKKISRLLQKELAIIFQKDTRSIFGNNKLFTITMVRVTEDLSIAKIYLSIFPVKGKEQLLAKIQEKTTFFRNILAKKIRHQIRVIPELHFFIDDSADYVDEINRLLKE